MVACRDLENIYCLMISSLPGKALRMLVGLDIENTRIAFFLYQVNQARH